MRATAPRILANSATSARNAQLQNGPAGLVLVLLLLFTGCHRAAPAGPAEHHTPAHKPADYSAAVAQLGRLHEEIVGGRARLAHELDVFTELGDVVRWLPELAADSDLPEEPWNRIARTSDELLVLVAQIQAVPADRRQAAYGGQSAQWERLLGELTSIVRAPYHRTVFSF